MLDAHPAGPPPPGPVPPVVLRLAAGDPVEGVWRNQLGGVTYRLGAGAAARYAKWQPTRGLTASARRDVDLGAEAARLAWAAGAVPVPRVLDAGEDDDGAWLVTAALPGLPAVAPRGLASPEVAVTAIADGLRLLHDRLDPEDCPFVGSWPGDAAVPEPDRLVVCHGDPCVPNTLLDEDGAFAGLVDLGRLGVADRWADLAIASESISWPFNLGPGWDGLFFDRYGVEPDHERIEAYRALWRGD